MKPDKVYKEADPEELGEYYVRHVAALTAEDLHAKSEIAAQLAVRDRSIERLENELKEQRKFLLEYNALGPTVEERQTRAIHINCTLRLHQTT